MDIAKGMPRFQFQPDLDSAQPDFTYDDGSEFYSGDYTIADSTMSDVDPSYDNGLPGRVNDIYTFDVNPYSTTPIPRWDAVPTGVIDQLVNSFSIDNNPFDSIVSTLRYETTGYLPYGLSGEEPPEIEQVYEFVLRGENPDLMAQPDAKIAIVDSTEFDYLVLSRAMDVISPYREPEENPLQTDMPEFIPPYSTPVADRNPIEDLLIVDELELNDCL